MALITGNGLVPRRFFSSGNPVARASSFDLTIGSIFDHYGEKVDGPFALKPGHMVQVVSAEVFDLPDTATGHVTYKTALTKKGIWALTVGIVDPGWKGPVTTTLLNFSSVAHAVAPGDTFLRVSFFEHPAVPNATVPRCQPVDEYLIGVRKTAMTRFPQTFLNKDEIVKKAGDTVLGRIRKEALVWIAVIAVIFSVIQLVSNYLRASDDLRGLRTQIESLESRLAKYEMAQTPSLPHNVTPLGLPPKKLP